MYYYFLVSLFDRINSTQILVDGVFQEVTDFVYLISYTQILSVRIKKVNGFPDFSIKMTC